MRLAGISGGFRGEAACMPPQMFNLKRTPKVNRDDYIRIRKGVYSAVIITPDPFGDWLVTNVRWDRMLEAAHGSRLAVYETLKQMEHDNELADIMPALIEGVRDLWFSRRSYSRA